MENYRREGGSQLWKLAGQSWIGMRECMGPGIECCEKISETIASKSPKFYYQHDHTACISHYNIQVGFSLLSHTLALGRHLLVD